MNWGMLLALFGAGLAVTTNCFGSSKGVGMVAEASSPVIEIHNLPDRGRMVVG